MVLQVETVEQTIAESAHDIDALCIVIVVFTAFFLAVLVVGLTYFPSVAPVGYPMTFFLSGFLVDISQDAQLAIGVVLHVFLLRMRCGWRKEKQNEEENLFHQLFRFDIVCDRNGGPLLPHPCLDVETVGVEVVIAATMASASPYPQAVTTVRGIADA